MVNLTNVGTLTSESGDVLDLNPLTYNGEQLATLADISNGSVSGGNGINVTGGVVSVDLYTTAVSSETLNIVGLNPIIDGQYTFVRNGCINGGVFYNTTSPRLEAPEYALFAKPDGSNWDIVYADDINAWHAATVNSDPSSWTNGQTIGFVSSIVYVAQEAPPLDYDYDTGSVILRAPQEADPNVSYSAGTGTVAESYLEFVNGKLRVDVTELQSALNIPPTPAQTYFAVPFTFSDSVVAIPDLVAGFSVTDVRVIMDTPFNGPGNLSIGTAANNGALLDGSFDPQIPGTQVEFGWHDVGGDPYSVYVNTSATAGNGRLLIQVVGSP